MGLDAGLGFEPCEPFDRHLIIGKLLGSLQDRVVSFLGVPFVRGDGLFQGVESSGYSPDFGHQKVLHDLPSLFHYPYAIPASSSVSQKML
jgi:hypothetical protein